MKQTIVVVPCYNEEARLKVSSFDTFLQANRNISILLVNDGSTDDTLAVLCSLQQLRPQQVDILDLPNNAGKAEAVRLGMLKAFAQQTDYVAYLDADLATPLEAIPQFCSVLDDRPDLQLVIGSRVALLGRQIERRWSRHLLGRLFATCASLVLNLAVYDTQCGAKMFRAGPQIESLFQQPFRSRWIFDVEILARMVYAHDSLGLRDVDQAIYEFPLMQWQDIAGSKLRLRDFCKAALELVAISKAYSTKHPYLPEAHWNITISATSLSAVAATKPLDALHDKSRRAA